MGTCARIGIAMSPVNGSPGLKATCVSNGTAKVALSKTATGCLPASRQSSACRKILSRYRMPSVTCRRTSRCLLDHMRLTPGCGPDAGARRFEQLHDALSPSQFETFHKWWRGLLRGDQDAILAGISL